MTDAVPDVAQGCSTDGRDAVFGGDHWAVSVLKAQPRAVDILADIDHDAT
jgi:hypothetical protein